MPRPSLGRCACSGAGRQTSKEIEERASPEPIEIVAGAARGHRTVQQESGPLAMTMRMRPTPLGSAVPMLAGQDPDVEIDTDFEIALRHLKPPLRFGGHGEMLTCFHTRAFRAWAPAPAAQIWRPTAVRTFFERPGG